MRLTLLFLSIIFYSFSQTTGEIVEKIERYTDPEKKFFKSGKLSFTWLVKAGDKVLSKRVHNWNIAEGDYEVLTKDKDGSELKIAFNINTKKGIVYRNAKKMEKGFEKYIESAYAWYINDSYWLIMPLKLRDDGVILKREKTEDYAYCLQMSFKNVGLTPGDKYWIYVGKKGEIKRWKFKLEGGKEGDFTWTDYHNIGNGVKFAGIKKSSKVSIEFDNIKLE